jgi:hypothetical protein
VLVGRAVVASARKINALWLQTFSTALIDRKRSFDGLANGPLIVSTAARP